MVDIRPVTVDRIPDAGTLFNGSSTTDHCWCMWFIVPVKEYHAAGAAGNQASFTALARDSTAPMGLLAYDGDTPVGWCAAGPRSRYARALRTPSYGPRDPAEDEAVWLVPCFYITREHRRSGVGLALLNAAVDLAREHGATAVEGFPLAGGKKRTGPDIQVGMEPLFAACGFTVARRPSANRVVMRRELSPGRRG